MKEGVKIGFLFFFVVVFALFFANTKGNDELNLNIEWPTVQKEEEFSFPIYASEYNGQYKNLAGNGVHAFVGKNADDTYRVYFIEVTAGKNVILKLDSYTLKGNKISFVDTSKGSNLNMKIEFSKDGFTVGPEQIGFSNEKIGGSYIKTNDIEQFSMSQFSSNIEKKK